MDVQKSEPIPPPPGVFGSLKAGFEIVSNRIVLILLPLGLDLLLWFGPRLSVNELLSPSLNYIFTQTAQNTSGVEVEQVQQTHVLLASWLEGFNLLSLLSKLQLFPVGIMSLAAQTLPTASPLGGSVVTVTSVWILLGASALLIPLGWIGGGVYFRQVSGSVLGAEETRVSFLRAIFQTLLLCLLWMIGLIIIFVPMSLILGLFALINPVLANIAILIGMFLSFWLIVPMFFTPHGIFIRSQNAFYSIYSSLRMTRFSLPTSGLFVLSVFLLSRGLDILWSVPSSESWLALVGFAGHAFITTTLLAASFIYYRDMNDWLQNVYEKFQQLGKKPTTTV